jgi:very-short-patch-repair endonuclease
MAKNPGMRSRAQQLRKHATKEENTLWYQYLHTLNPQWRRQMVVGGYILDFYCRKLKLDIEVDGPQHYQAEGLAYDRERTNYLQAQGIAVLRFTNDDIDRRLEAVCANIEAIIEQRTKSFPFGEAGSRRLTEEEQ